MIFYHYSLSKITILEVLVLSNYAKGKFYALYELISLKCTNNLIISSMDRKTKILMNALSTKDETIMRQLHIPKYETTKGLNISEIDILLTSEYKIIMKFVFLIRNAAIITV